MAKKVEQTSPLIEQISPMVIEFKPKKVVWGDRVARTYVITQYPNQVSAAWLSRVSNMEGVTVSIQIDPTDPFELVREIRRSSGELSSRLMDVKNPFEQQRTKDQLEDVQQLLKEIDRDQQSVVNLTTLLLVGAENDESLEVRCRRVEAELAAGGLRARTPILRQEDCFKGLTPWEMVPKNITAIGQRNMTAKTAAASYPFVFSGLNDGKGILLGTDTAGGIVLTDFWVRQSDRTNSNVTVIGKPGVGKSTLVKKILANEWAQGSKVIVIDPENEYGDLCKNIGGQYIDAAGDPKGRINPLQVRAVPADDDEESDPLFETEVDDGKAKRGPLAQHFQVLRSFFRMYLKDMTVLEEVLLERALEVLYKSKGISWTTEPTSLSNEDWPTLEELYELILEASKTNTENGSSSDETEKEWKTLAMRLRSSAIGADSFLWNGATTIKAESDFIVLNINKLLEADERTMRAQFYNILGWVWDEVSRDKDERVFIAVDETYLLADPDHPQPLQFLRNTSKRIRKREGGLMSIFHNLVDMLDPSVQRYGQALIDNPVYKFIMGQGDKDIEALQKLMSLSEREVQTLADGRRGEALFVAGSKRLHLKIDVTQEELELFGAGGGR
jgi:GTPase SAR1 family protein